MRKGFKHTIIPEAIMNLFLMQIVVPDDNSTGKLDKKKADLVFILVFVKKQHLC